MSRVLTATRKRNIWQLALVREVPKSARLITINLGAAERDASDLVAATSAKLADPIWQLELSSYAYMEARPDILIARTLVTAVQAAAENTLAVALNPGVRPQTALAVARHLLGQPPARWRSAVALATALPLAMGMLVALVLRYGGSAPRDLKASITRPLLALHTEDESRTRHLARIAATTAPDRHGLLLLGRPRHNQAGGLSAVDPKGELKHLDAVRPLDLRGVLRAFPRGAGHTVRGARAIAESGLDLSLRTRVAMLYRFLQGEAHADWWRRRVQLAPVPTRVLFGHTGTADTTLLERAMQRGGSRTVHVCHGTNLGWPFAALSDLGLFQSRHDAQLAASLPGYGRTAALASAPPTILSGDDRWGLLTSYTHPLNPAYMQGGAEADLKVLDWLAQAARATGQAPDKVFWRPHPMLAHARPEDQQRLKTAVALAGFVRWPEDLDYGALGKFGAVVTTPSTALTDGLRLGTVPILAVAAPLQSDLVYNAHPLIARNAESLAHALSICAQPPLRNKAFEAAWDAIGPSATLSMTVMMRDPG